jgi:REP element-mobilizing transposase RayT
VARKYEGAIYHVMNRGDRQEPIFIDEKDREIFLETLGECCRKTGCQVHTFCLMLNQFHVVLETPPSNLIAGMRWFLGTYAARFNRRHKFFGLLFSGRYKTTEAKKLIGTPGSQPGLAKRDSKAGGTDTGMSATGSKRCRTKIKTWSSHWSW